MSIVAARLTGTGTGGDFKTSAPLDKLTRARAQIAKEQIDLFLAGTFGRNLFAGGGQHVDLDASVAGSFDLLPWLPIGIDNRDNRISDFDDDNGATLVIQFRFLVLTTLAAVSVTPRVYDITAAAAATTSGAAACTATSEAYGGTNQQQTLALTLPNAFHYFKPQLTIGGTPAPGARVRGTALYDCYISLP